MKPITRLLAVVCLTLFICNCQNKTASTETTPPQEQPGALATEKDKISYIIGANIAMSIVNIKDEISLDQLYKGIEDRLSGQPLLVAEDEMNTLMQQFVQKIQQKQMAEQQAKAQANLAAGQAFLEENAKKEGVTTTASGLQYMVVRQAEGPLPVPTDTVKVDYEGTTIDGNVFDSSYKRGQPATFPVTNVIPGWVEALQLMPVGSKYKLFIPSALAYGEQGAGPQIGPNSVLIFDVELLDIVKQDESGQPVESAQPDKPAQPE